MHVLALKEKTLANPSKQDALDEMLNICALSPTPKALEKLYGCKCLPVKLASGEIRWMDRSGDFAIVDRREYGELFKDRINVLDFSLEEVHNLNPFLSGLGLAERYMSQSVWETTTTPSDGTIRERLTNDLRKKAYAIFR
jgi:hypothetical protein